MSFIAAAAELSIDSGYDVVVAIRGTMITSFGRRTVLKSR